MVCGLWFVDASDRTTHTQSDGILAVQRVACALLGQRQVAIPHQARTGEVLAAELQQVALVEQRGLKRPVLLGQLRDLWGAQATQPIQALGA